jgi:hypothetical protein
MSIYSEKNTTQCLTRAFIPVQLLTFRTRRENRGLAMPGSKADHVHKRASQISR